MVEAPERKSIGAVTLDLATKAHLEIVKQFRSTIGDLERQLAEARAGAEMLHTHNVAGFDEEQALRKAAEAERDRLAADNARLREALERLLNPAPGVKKLPPWVYGIAKPALAGKE